jgi:hypothetical protein
MVSSIRLSVSNTVRITTRVRGATREIGRIAFSPLISGILRSRITMSGCNSLAFSIASLPL